MNYIKGILCCNHRADKQSTGPPSKLLNKDSPVLKLWPWFGTSIRGNITWNIWSNEIRIFSKFDIYYSYKVAPFYFCSLQIQIHTSHHVKEIKVHVFRHGTVSLVFPELFNLKGTKYLKFKVQFSYSIYSYDI